MPADGITLPLKGGTSARPAGAARRLGYITKRIGGRGHDRLWHSSTDPGIAASRQQLGLDRTSQTLSFDAIDPNPTSLSESHQHLMITAAEWEAFLDDLQQALDKFTVPQAEQAEIKAIVASTRADIVV
jgi:hypothetical protein